MVVLQNVGLGLVYTRAAENLNKEEQGINSLEDQETTGESLTHRI